MGVGFSLAVMPSSRRFEILCSFSFFGVRVFLVSNARERFTHQKKRKKKKKQIATLNIFFCLFVCFSRHKAHSSSGTFSARHETPSQNRERPYSSREEEEEEDKEDKEEEEEEKKS